MKVMFKIFIYKINFYWQDIFGFFIRHFQFDRARRNNRKFRFLISFYYFFYILSRARKNRYSGAAE